MFSGRIPIRLDLRLYILDSIPPGLRSQLGQVPEMCFLQKFASCFSYRETTYIHYMDKSA